VLPKKQKKSERTPRRRQEPEACAARSFPVYVYRLALARAGRALQSKGGGVGKKEEQEEGKKREVSSIDGLPFCSPARQIAFFFYRFFFLVIHFAGAVILSRSFWGSLERRRPVYR
jgi:hypothetical protein